MYTFLKIYIDFKKKVCLENEMFSWNGDDMCLCVLLVDSSPQGFSKINFF